MADEKRFENEEIQKGLEDFVDRQLNLDFSLTESNQKEPMQKKPAKADFDIIGYTEDAYDELKFDLSTDRTGNDSHDRGPTDRTRVASHGKKPADRTRVDSYGKKPADRVRTDSQGKKSADRARTDSRDQKSTEHTRRDTSARSRREDEREREIKQSKKQAKNQMTGKKNKNSKKQNKKKKKNGAAKAFLVFLAVFFILIFGGIHMAVNHVYQKMTYNEVESMTKESYKDNGVVNVLLIGNDSRLGGDDGRSDAMILVSISDKTKTITMTSFLRDMYVEIPGHDGNRLNAAYAYGGPELLMQTIEQNFDIPVHRYALVNFEAFANLVDAVGGIDLEVTNEEVQLINGYLMEYNQLLGRNLDYDWLDASASGVIHLNGPQALAYTRNRYIGTDFGRTERQRKVLAEVFKKLPGAMVTNSGGVIDGLFPNLTTNLKQNECYKIALGGYKIIGYDMVQQCVPLEGTYSNATIRSMAVLEVDFEANKRFLKETLYGE